MPRRPRLSLPHVPLHVIQRGNNRQTCFADDEDRQNYLKWLREYASATGCKVHAFVLMDNHVHLLLSAERAEAPGQLMKALGQRYVQYFNRRYQRSGTLWEGRFRSSLIDAESYLMTCYRYIESNPVRAGLVAHPEAYRWSSYAANAHGEPDSLVTPHALYRALGRSAAQRQAAYRAMFDQTLQPGMVDALRRATNGNFALGTPRFADEVAALLGRRATQGKAGRPKKVVETDEAQAAAQAA
jgi:putative transposase